VFLVVDVDVSNVADRKTRLRIGKNSRIPESDVTKYLDYPRTLTLTFVANVVRLLE
jgi:hypothetical protein